MVSCSNRSYFFFLSWWELKATKRWGTYHKSRKEILIEPVGGAMIPTVYLLLSDCSMFKSQSSCLYLRQEKRKKKSAPVLFPIIYFFFFNEGKQSNRYTHTHKKKATGYINKPDVLKEKHHIYGIFPHLIFPCVYN